LLQRKRFRTDGRVANRSSAQFVCNKRLRDLLYPALEDRFSHLAGNWRELRQLQPCDG